jgi:ubiquinone biosynthesis protein
MRFDLLPADYCYEFFKLLNEVRPFPYARVREIVRQELGGDPEAVFRSFEPEPFAAASIGQVHRAVLPSGRRVAVKVQRPDVDRLFRTDLALMYRLTGLADRLRLFGSTRTREIVDEFARWTAEELDYLVEARHGERLRRNARGDPLERNARVYRAYTTRRVLTTELIDGVPLIEVMYALGRRDTAYLDALAARGYDLARAARNIDWNMLNQMHVDGYFHADLHPANLFLLPGNAVGYVDFGIVGQLADEPRESLTQYTRYLYRGDVDRAVGELLRWVTPAPWTDTAAARADLVRAHEEFLLAVGAPGTAVARGAVSACALEVMATVRRHEMALAPGIVAYLKTLLTVDTLRFALAPSYDLPTSVRRFLGRLLAEEARAQLDPRQAVRSALEYGLRLRRVMERFEAQQEVAASIEAFAADVQHTVGTVRRRLVVLAALTLAAGGALYLVLTAPEPVLGPLARLPLGAAPVVLLGSMVVLVLALLQQSRPLGREAERASDVRRGVRRRWGMPPEPRRVHERSGRG